MSASFKLFNKETNECTEANTISFEIQEDTPCIFVDGKLFKKYIFDITGLSTQEVEDKCAEIFEKEYDIYVLYSTIVSNVHSCGCNNCETECGDKH